MPIGWASWFLRVASAYTQYAAMGDVVKSRLPLALASAAVALVVFAIFGGSGGAVGQNVAAEVTPVGLTMLIPFALVIILALRRHHIIVALTWGSITAIVGGLLSGMMAPGDIFSIPGEPGDSTGLIEDGISGVTGAVIFVLFVLALGRLLTDSGLMARLLGKLEAMAARGVRSAEFTIVSASLLFSIPLSANAPAILLVGPTVAKPLGRRYNLAPARIANLLDCTVCTVYYMLPWHNIAIIWFGVLVETADERGLPLRR